MKYLVKGKNFELLLAHCIDKLNEYSRASVDVERENAVIERTGIKMLKFNFIESAGSQRELLEKVLMHIVRLMRVHKVGFERVGVQEDPNGAWRIELEGEPIELSKKIKEVVVLEMRDSKSGYLDAILLLKS